MQTTGKTTDTRKTTIEAVIFDLDGVITRTARLHGRAWKVMFDSFLSEYGRSTGKEFTPMDADHDYREYVDGRPRYEGAEMFLKSRGITIPFGSPDDDPSMKTVCGLGNRKNLLYHELLDKEGPEVFEDTIAAIRRFRSAGKKTAVISSSKNCRDVLSAAGITGMFDFIADGNDAQEKNIPGKPAPDIFLYAARQLNVTAAQSIIAEDSAAGIRAGHDGGFAYSVGIARNGNSSLLYESGADIVISSFDELPDLSLLQQRTAAELPDVWDHLDYIVDGITGKKPLVLLDYDGTLTPIVARPELALLPDSTAEVLGELARIVPAGIVSGRDLGDLMSLVVIDGLLFAGSHGFDIRTADGTTKVPEATGEVPALLDAVETELDGDLAKFDGVQKERKRFMLALHYRNIRDPDAVDYLRNRLESIINRHDNLTLSTGKKVFEVRPAIDWHKGKAVTWIINHLFGRDGDVFPLYIGDDTTDEDAFRAVKGHGAAILVGDHGGGSYADYHLDDPNDVRRFLAEITAQLHAKRQNG